MDSTDAKLARAEGVFTDSEDDDSQTDSEEEDSQDSSDEEDGEEGWANLLDLAQQIMALHSPEKGLMFAERMINCGQNNYSRSFYEMSTKIDMLKDKGYSLKETVKYLAGKVPPLEDLQAQLAWGAPVTINKETIQSYARMVLTLGNDGREQRLARRIGNKAAVDEWKLAALRTADFYQRNANKDPTYKGILMDQKLAEKELTELKKHVGKVTAVASGYKLRYPIFPPSSDIAPWVGNEKSRGYWITYNIKLQDPLPPPEDVEDHLPMVLATVVQEEGRSISLTESMATGSLSTHLPQTQLLATDTSMKRMVHDTGKMGIYKADGTPVQIDNIQQIQQITNLEAIDENEVEVVTVDPNMLSDDDQSDAEEATRIIDEMGFLHTTEQLSHGTYQICDATEHRDVSAEGTEFPTDAQQTSDNTDRRNATQVEPPTTFDKDFPLLPAQNTVAQEQNNTAQHRGNNIWVDKSKNRSFMNGGLGGKLHRNDTISPSFHIDVSRAFSIKDIWGYSLLGQYVGHHPGHFLINSMIKGWGVKAKYKMEEGWFIFTFNTQEDQEKVLLGGPYLIHGRPMILKYIPDKFAFNKRDVAKVPLWVRIYGLASRFWTVENLGGIASYIGNPLYMDPVTESRKRNAYARVLVEINLAAEINRKVPITFSDGDTIEVNFLVENEPKFCHECCTFGHDIKVCNFNKKKATVGANDKPGNTQTQLNTHRSDQHTTGIATHMSSQENNLASVQGIAVHIHEDICHNKVGSTEEQQHTQHTSIQGTNYEQNLRNTNKQHRIWIEKKKEIQENTNVARRQDENSEQTSQHDGCSNSPHGTAMNIPLKNSFEALQDHECTHEEMVGKSGTQAAKPTQGISQAQHTRRPTQPATVT